MGETYIHQVCFDVLHTCETAQNILYSSVKLKVHSDQTREELRVFARDLAQCSRETVRWHRMDIEGFLYSNSGQWPSRSQHALEVYSSAKNSFTSTRIQSRCVRIRRRTFLFLVLRPWNAALILAYARRRAFEPVNSLSEQTGSTVFLHGLTANNSRVVNYITTHQSGP